VPEATAFRTELPASRRAGSLRALAQALSGAAAVACLLAFQLAPSPLRLAAALASAAALVLALRPSPTSALPPRIGVDAGGAVQVRTGDADEAAAVGYCAPHYICLQTRRGPLPVWPDSIAAADWRRLLVACRWSRRQDGDGRPAPADRRTK